MKIDDIMAEWGKDADIDPTQLSNESLKIPKLHHKYYRIFVEERMRLYVLQREYDERSQILYDWMDGKLDRDELQKHELEPYPYKRLKSDIEKRVPLEPDMVAKAERIMVQKEKIALLESIIKSLSTRQFTIKNAIDFIKFQQAAF